MVLVKLMVREMLTFEWICLTRCPFINSFIKSTRLGSARTGNEAPHIRKHGHCRQDTSRFNGGSRHESHSYLVTLPSLGGGTNLL